VNLQRLLRGGANVGRVSERLPKVERICIGDQLRLLWQVMPLSTRGEGKQNGANPRQTGMHRLNLQIRSRAQVLANRGKQHNSIRHMLAVSIGFLALGCGGAKQDFISGLAFDSCNQAWPICDQVAGCIMSPQTYTEGRLPGGSELIVKIDEPSTVRVHMYLENVRAAGNQTALDFYETGCVNRIRDSVTGNAFVSEFDQTGDFVREADLLGIGDHLIQLSSDTECNYTLKLEVIPKRTQ